MCPSRILDYQRTSSLWWQRKNGNVFQVLDYKLLDINDKLVRPQTQYHWNRGGSLGKGDCSGEQSQSEV